MRRRDLLLSLPMAVLVLAPSLRAGDGEDVRAVIGSQIEAFGAEDLESAYGFASPMIQRMFPTPEIFGRMVREGYPMIWRPDGVRYLELREEDGRLLQRMEFSDGDGRNHLFDYEMVEGPDGWRINGVYPVPEPGLAA
ncbi:hypothetical protein DEA8626_00364 [Defluviimonas aquaemixtae]|uniref:DUF4864 domain-containing protein n=1 Tax=Albidovulum aquaemixtae TaxID=1542388 RepID=A0A2R8B2S7_9RHOB|nr:DUF4864 domain-containing protein [Defluviimonas aquaemixtae]SPH16850.1 hypothetical protein DEA8626_00364 [Defluviimonas aquaemixtae]